MTAKRRSAALNGEARAELKGGNARRAADAYRKVIAETETLDSEGAAVADRASPARGWLLAAET